LPAELAEGQSGSVAFTLVSQQEGDLLRKQVMPEDFGTIGLIPELVGCLPVLATPDDLPKFSEMWSGESRASRSITSIEWARDQVILPAKHFELLDRNVVQFGCVSGPSSPASGWRRRRGSFTARAGTERRTPSIIWRGLGGAQ